MTYTAGIDVGASAVKTVLMEYGNGSGSKVLFKDCRRMLRRNPADVAEESLHDALEVVGISLPDVAYVASTGEGEMVRKKRGHFYSMTTHARGALFLYPEARAVMDLGALHGRAMKVNEKARVLSYQMTGPCASGSGQFTENITRYLGMPRRRRPALPPVAPPRAGLLDLRGPRRNRRHQHGLARHRHARHHPRHPRVDRPAPRQAPLGAEGLTPLSS